ncbi:MAG: Hsp20/alpha crystallin family protein [bacterium]|nr:Hsp20/alpha crystallin family protein [bacterium]
MRNFDYFMSRMYSLTGGMHDPEKLEHLNSATWQPPANVYEREHDFVIVLELPGIDKDKIVVEVDGGVLRIQGVRQMRIPDNTRHVQQLEIPYGNFTRLVRLPEDTHTDAIEAEYKDGYLTVSIPRSSEEDPTEAGVSDGAKEVEE